MTDTVERAAGAISEHYRNEAKQYLIEDAAFNRQVPYPSPESVVARVLADCSPPAGVKRTAHQITKALRAAGWRILR